MFVELVVKSTTFHQLHWLLGESSAFHESCGAIGEIGKIEHVEYMFYMYST